MNSCRRLQRAGASLRQQYPPPPPPPPARFGLCACQAGSAPRSPPSRQRLRAGIDSKRVIGCLAYSPLRSRSGSFSFCASRGSSSKRAEDPNWTGPRVKKRALAGQMANIPSPTQPQIIVSRGLDRNTGLDSYSNDSSFPPTVSLPSPPLPDPPGGHERVIHRFFQSISSLVNNVCLFACLCYNRKS